MSRRCDISVVIPSLGRDEILAATVRQLTLQRGVTFEIIVVDQNEPILPIFREFVRSYSGEPPLVHVTLAEKSASAARNVGLLVASSDIVLFLDDDVLIDETHLLEAHVRNYTDCAVAAVAGQMLGLHRAVRGTRHFLSFAHDSGWLYFPLSYNARSVQPGVGRSANLSVRRSAALAVGGMDERFIKGAFREESDFLQRLRKGLHFVVFEPRASLVHLEHHVGGIRNWKSRRRAMHHLTGEWYFILRHATWQSIAHLIFAAARNQRPVIARPRDILEIPIALLRSIAALGLALKNCLDGSLTLDRAMVLENRRQSIEDNVSRYPK